MYFSIFASCEPLKISDNIDIVRLYICARYNIIILSSIQYTLTQHINVSLYTQSTHITSDHYELKLS